MVSRRVYFSVVNNVVYVAFGPVLFLLGGYMMYFYRRFIPLVDELTWMMPLVFMVLGICTIFIAIFACLQLATEFVVTAVCYFVIVVLLISSLIGAGAFWVNVSPSYPGFVNDTFEKAYNSYEEYQMHEAWTVMQRELQCCGMNGMADFEAVHKDIPIECCRNKAVSVCPPDDMDLDGCLYAFLYRVYLDRYLLGTVAILAGVLMLLMLVISAFVCFDDDRSDMGGVDGMPYCIDDDEGDDQYYQQMGMTTVDAQHHEKHPAFLGVDMTYVPDQAPPETTIQSPPPPQTQQINILQPTPSTSTQPFAIPKLEAETLTQTVVIEEVRPSVPPPKPIQHRLVRVVRKLPMLESGGSRVRYCASPSRSSNCPRCSHVSKCKLRRGLMERVPRSVSRVSLQDARRMSHSPEHVIMEAPKSNRKMYCRRVDGRTVCRATPI